MRDTIFLPQRSQRFNKKQPQVDADFADYTELLVGLGSLGLARLDVNLRQSQNLRPQAISTNGRSQKLLVMQASAQLINFFQWLAGQPR